MARRCRRETSIRSGSGSDLIEIARRNGAEFCARGSSSGLRDARALHPGSGVRKKRKPVRPLDARAGLYKIAPDQCRKLSFLVIAT